MENPYQPPDKPMPDFRDLSAVQPAPVSHAGNAGMTAQVTVVAILMIVQGALCTMMGLFLIPFAFIMPAIMQQDQQFQANPPPEGMLVFMTAMYAGMGLAGFLPGILLIYAGIRNLYYKGRVLGLIALGAGSLSIGTCYCGFTAVGLLVYGLIVYLNDPVRIAFELGERGYTKDQIMAHFYSYQVPAQKPPGAM